MTVTPNPHPTWQPLSALPRLGALIETLLQEAEAHYQTLQAARPRPHVLDDVTVERIITVFGAPAGDLGLFEGPLVRWRQAQPTAAQQQAMDRLNKEGKR